MSKTKFRYSFIRLHTGSVVVFRRLPLMEAKTTVPGPTVWLTACAHGDEVGGIVIIQEIFKKLRKYPLLKGKLMAFPMMNPIGFETATRKITMSEEDLNRSFPGSPDGSLAERMAYVVFETIINSQPAFVFDLHNDWRRSIPYALIDLPLNSERKAMHDKILDITRALGLYVVADELTDDRGITYQKTLSGSLMMRDIPAVTLELGESYTVNEKHVDYGIEAVWRGLVSLGMVDENTILSGYSIQKHLENQVLEYNDFPHATSSGIVRFTVKPGDIVTKGQTVGRIYNTFGKLTETLRAPEASVVLCYSDYAVSFPGMPVIAFGQINS